MNEFEVIVNPKAGSIETNFKELKKQLEFEMSAYKGMKVTEDNLSDSKKDLAFLRKLKKSINDKKIEIKKAYMQPYEEFEVEYKDFLSIVEKPIEEIDVQIKEFNTKRIAVRQEHIKEIYKEAIGPYEEYLPLDKIKNPKWDNASYSDKDIRFDISECATRVRSEIDAIKALHSEIEEECLIIYKRSGNNLAAAITKNSDYLAAKTKAEEKVREEIKEAQKEAKKIEECINPPEFKEEKKDVYTFRVSGTENIAKVKEFLDFTEIPYEGV